MKWCVAGPKMKIDVARNTACDIVNDAEEITHLLFIDDDMVLTTPNMVDILLRHDKDIIVPLFFRSEPPFEPLVFETDPADNLPVPMKSVPTDQLFEAPAGAGTGVMLIKAEVIRAMKEKYGKVFFASEHASVSFDLAFCARACELGYRTFCDSSIVIPQMTTPKPNISIGILQMPSKK